jgi:hypothetical protein
MKQMKPLIAVVISFTFTMNYLFSQCLVQGNFLNETYISGWTLQDDQIPTTISTVAGGCDNAIQNGTITTAGSCKFLTARCAKNLRIYKSLPSSLSNLTWTVDFSFTFDAAPAGGYATNAPAVTLLAFTSNNLALRQTCAIPVNGQFCGQCGSYPFNNMDAVWATLASTPGPGTCTSNTVQNAGGPWSIIAYGMDNGNTPVSSTPINLNGSNQYWIRLQRTSLAWVTISVFSNAAYTNHIPGSPQCLYLNPQTMSVTGLNTVQHGVEPQGSCRRISNITIPSFKIDNSVPCPMPLTAAFSTISSACGNLSFNASATTGSPFQEEDQYWSIVPCDQSGNSQGHPVWDTWVHGNAGVYTFPTAANGGPSFITCGNYYLVTLAVNNCVNPWNQVSHVIYVDCPTIYAGPDIATCTPLTQNAIFGNNANNNPPWVNFAWSSSNPNVTLSGGNYNTGGAMGEGQSTLTLVATDVNGCTATDQLNYIGIVANAGPDRKICYHGANQTLSGWVEIGGNSTDGFNYSWSGTGASFSCSTCSKTLVHLNSPGTVVCTLTVTDPVTLLQCQDFVNVTLNPSPNGANMILNLPSNYSVDCNSPGSYYLGGSFFNGSSIIPYNYTWTSITNPSINNLTYTVTSNSTSFIPQDNFANCNSGSNSATFYLTITDADGCQISDYVTVNYVNAPNLGGGNENGIQIIQSQEKSNTEYFSKYIDDIKNEMHQINIMPNPNSGTFNLSFESPLAISPTLYIIDLSGRILHTQSISLQKGLNQLEISKPELPAGIYFIKVDGFDEPIKMIISK